MSTVQEIQRAIERLSEEELIELSQWIWNRECAPDAEKGLLNEPAAGALREHREGLRQIEAALDRLSPEQLRLVSDGIAARLMPKTTPAMLAALDEGIRSLQTEPLVPAEAIRHKIKEWSTA